MAERVESAIEMQLKPVLQRKLFCIGTIFFSLFSLLLLIDFPIFILFSIGLWRLYFAGRVDYSEIRISKALSWMVTCCFCGIIMLELTAVHWGLQIQLATKASTPYRGIMQTNAACLPLFYMLILGLVTAYRAKKGIIRTKLLGISLLALGVLFLAGTFVYMMKAHAVQWIVLCLFFIAFEGICACYGILLSKNGNFV